MQLRDQLGEKVVLRLRRKSIPPAVGAATESFTATLDGDIAV